MSAAIEPPPWSLYQDGALYTAYTTTVSCTTTSKDETVNMDPSVASHVGVLLSVHTTTTTFYTKHAKCKEENTATPPPAKTPRFVQSVAEACLHTLRQLFPRRDGVQEVERTEQEVQQLRRTQLKVLSGFRSTLLHLYSRYEKQVIDGLETVEKDADENAVQILQTTYRLLLELALSSPPSTPTTTPTSSSSSSSRKGSKGTATTKTWAALHSSIRRAAYSCLHALLPCNTLLQNCILVEDIHQSIFKSLVVVSGRMPRLCFWRDGVSSLAEGMSNYPPLAAYILAEATRVWQVLEFLAQRADACKQESRGRELPLQECCQLATALRAVLLPLMTVPKKTTKIHAADNAKAAQVDVDAEDAEEEILQSPLQAFLHPTPPKLDPNSWIQVLQRLEDCPLGSILLFSTNEKSHHDLPTSVGQDVNVNTSQQEQALVIARTVGQDGLCVAGVAWAQCRLARHMIQSCAYTSTSTSTSTSSSNSSSSAMDGKNQDDWMYNTAFECAHTISFPTVTSTTQDNATTTNAAVQNVSPQAYLRQAPLQRLAMVRGYIAVLPSPILTQRPIRTQNHTKSVLCGILAPPLLHAAMHAPDVMVRLSAWRGLDGWLSRAVGLMLAPSSLSSKDDDDDEEGRRRREEVHDVASQIQTAVLEGWARPPSRQIAVTLPHVFGSVVKLLQALHRVQSSKEKNGENEEGEAFPEVKEVLGLVLSQPLNRKGRYEALTVLLPMVGAHTLMQLSTTTTNSSFSSSNALVSSLMEGIAEAGNNSGAIASLLGQLLSKLLQEMYTRLGVVPRGGGGGGGKNYRQRKKEKNQRKKQLQQQKLGQQTGKPADGANVAVENQNKSRTNEKPPPSQLPPQWIQAWAPSLACALLSKVPRQRSEVASFCLPLLQTVGGREEAPFVFMALLVELRKQGSGDDDGGEESRRRIHDVVRCYRPAGDVKDRYLWAALEVS